MKTLRQLTASALLLLVLTLPTLAGDMHCPVAPPPPPPAQPAMMSDANSASGGMTLGEETTELDALTELSLLMLQGALALF